VLISWSRDAYGNTTWRIWGIKITLKRIVALLILASVMGGVQAFTKKPAVADAYGPPGMTQAEVYRDLTSRPDPGCTTTHPRDGGDGYCYSR
jgi:hypothetical protein